MYEKETGKKKIGSTLIRQIHNSCKLGKAAIELEKNAKLMGHSAATAIKHYVKIDWTYIKGFSGFFTNTWELFEPKDFAVI